MQAMTDQPSPDEVAAAERGLSAGFAYLRAIVHDAHAAQPRLPAAVHHQAIALLLQTRECLRPMIPDAIAIQVDAAILGVCNVTPAESDRARAESRALLIDNGLLTEGELNTFPRTSLQAIALDRFQQRERGE
jgi:hypothetical protein